MNNTINALRQEARTVLANWKPEDYLEDTILKLASIGYRMTEALSLAK